MVPVPGRLTVDLTRENHIQDEAEVLPGSPDLGHVSEQSPHLFVLLVDLHHSVFEEVDGRCFLGVVLGVWYGELDVSGRALPYWTFI
jgi:hypothetical protein